MNRGRAINLVATTGAELVRAEIAIRHADDKTRLQREVEFALADRRHRAAIELLHLVEDYPELFV